MNGFTELKDIRFPDTKANILLRGGMISRENLMNIKDAMITMSDVHFGIAKRINDVTSLEVKHLDEWRSVMCGDTTTLQSIYALTPSDEDVEKYEHKILTDKVEIPSAQKIESADEDTVKVLQDLFENPVDLGPSIMGDSVPHVEVKDEEPVEKTESHEDEIVEEDEDTHEEAETVETTSCHDPDDDYDADEMPEESPEEVAEDATKIDPAKVDEVFVTGMTVGDAIKGSGIGTITGVTTIASDSTDNTEVTEEPASDVSNAEPITTSTSTASTNINSQGNARRQVNINAHGKHRRR